MEDIFKKIRNEDLLRSNDDHLEGCIFKVLFCKRSPLLVDELFPALIAKLASDSFQLDVINLFRSLILAQKEQTLADVKKCEQAGVDSRFYSFHIPKLDRQLSIKSLPEYIDFLNDPEEGHPAIVDLYVDRYNAHHSGDTCENSFIRSNYYLYNIGSMLYDQFVGKASLFERFQRSESSRLSSIYQGLGIDLATSDLQFSKYGLLSFGEDFRIHNNKESKTIVDPRVGLNFWIEVPRDLLMAIEAAITAGFVKDISFRVDGITDSTPSFEDVEYGSIFNFHALKLPSVSKLYDAERYDDSLWIKVDKTKSSMTFEELYADFPEQDEKVVTQIVHLELVEEEGAWFISHIDHEYILYTFDEYSKRLTNPKIKGHDKVKTFKIDNARIPFEFSFNNRYFLYQALDSYFKNKALVREYFSSIDQL